MAQVLLSNLAWRTLLVLNMMRRCYTVTSTGVLKLSHQLMKIALATSMDTAIQNPTVGEQFLGILRSFMARNLRLSAKMSFKNAILMGATMQRLPIPGG